MRIRCEARELTDGQRMLLKVPSRLRPTNRLTVGKEYLVLGIVSIVDSPQYGNTALFEIVNDDGQLVRFPAALFSVADPRCSALWRAEVHRDGSVTLRPEELYREFFHDDLSEGDPATRQALRTAIAKLEAEFTAEATHQTEGPVTDDQ